MSTSCIGTVKDAIRAALVIRSGLSGVNVFTAPVSFADAGLECIAFGEARLNEEAMSMNANRWEVWDIDGEIRVMKAWQGDIETTIKAARDRDLAIFAELETHINDTYTGTLPDVEVTGGTIAEDYNPDGRIASLLFTLTLKASKNP